MPFLSDVLFDPWFLLCALTVLWLLRLIKRTAARQQKTIGLVLLMMVFASLSLLIGSPVIVNPLLHKYESRYPESPACVAELTPLVALAGGVDSRALSANDIHHMSEATLARVSEALLLVRAQEGLDYPLIVAGGGRGGVSEAQVMQQFLLFTGVPAQRLLREDTSGNTAQNAANVAQLFVQNNWRLEIRLITSALHMARASAVFEKQGFAVCAVSVDQQAIRPPWYAVLPQTSVLVKTGKLVHEIVGTFYYRFRGWM